MNYQYGCQVSNRYTGFLDSSDYGYSADFDGNSLSKRKAKKKRKPKYRKYANKAVNTDDLIETAENFHAELDTHEAEMADKIYKEITFETNDSLNAATASEATTQTNTSIDSGKCTAESTVDGQSSASDSKFIKWSEICFEEEKATKKMEMKMKTQAVHQLETNEKFEKQAPAVEERKVYPTMFFYNSNYRGLHRIDGPLLPHQRHNSFQKMDTRDGAGRMKRRQGRRPSKRSPKVDTK